MKLIAKIPCSFGGKKFFIGDVIPAEDVLNPKAQEKLGVITIVDGENAGDGTSAGVSLAPGPLTPIFVKVEEGVLELEVSGGDLQEIFNVLTSNVEEAETIIEQMTNGDALLLLHVSDGRKTVKAAAEARAKAIGGDDEGENPENPENPDNQEDGAGEE